MAIFGVTKPASRMFRAGEATATFDGINAILINVQAQVTRNLSPIPTLTEGIVWSASPVSGQISAQTIIASDKKITDIANQPCKRITATIDFKGAECLNDSAASGSVKLKIDDGYCNSISVTASGAQGYIGSDLAIMFTKAELS